ncbi:MAG TPA: MMPL family transporter [Mycobacteriales bacterium]|nr:MMPL family transporter [Mycobacteriales bacterium]
MLTRLGEVLVRRARLVLVVATIAVAAAAVLGFGAFGRLKGGGQDDPHSESVQAQNIVDTKYGGENNLVFLVSARTGAIDSGPAAAAGARLTRQLADTLGVGDVQSYWPDRTASLKSGRSALVLVRTNGSDNANNELIDKYATNQSDYAIRAGGSAGFSHDVTPQLSKSLAGAELIAVPILLVLLLFVFGSVVSALLPLMVGAIAILGTFAELFVLTSITNVSIYAINLTTGLGMGLGIDYALLMVSRYRERLAAGDDGPTAVVHTVRTAGRTILFSAATVATALAALLVFPQYFLRSFAYAGVGVVAIAALAAVLVLPAVLAVLGHRVNSGRLPWSQVHRAGDAPIWGRLAGYVMRHPGRTALPVVALLVVLAIPLSGLHFGSPDDRVLRSNVASRQVGDTLRSEFGGTGSSDLSVVATGPVGSAAIATYAGTLSKLPHVSRVQSSAGIFVDGRQVATNPDAARRHRADGALLDVTASLDPASTTAQDLVRTIRATPAPTSVLVGGSTALLVDNNHTIADRLMVAIPMIALTTFVLLFLFTGSIIQPLRSLILSALSLSATLGVVVWVFQSGHFRSLLGFAPMPIDTAMTVLLFCVAFGLSMDYEVFLTSRIKELHDAGADTEEAVTQGLARTGRIVTAAATLLAVTFFAFMTGTVSFLQLFGLGAGLAVLIDATLVRVILVPAALRLLGEWAWYAPRGLHRVRTRLALNES